MDQSDVERQLRDVTERIVASRSPKRLIVAGPGTGKTTLFRTLLERDFADRNRRLVLTFLNNLKADLEEKLRDLARVFTFHGYCRALLHRSPGLRSGLSADFSYFPPLPSLIRSDWELTHVGQAPHFVQLMRELSGGEGTSFYLKRSEYYDAVSFDDSVFRTYVELRRNQEKIEPFDLVLVDEYQDFNRLEASFIDLLAAKSRIVIAGDDDQALYSQLRGSSTEFIRSLHGSGLYDCFELPRCMRCPEVIVLAVGDAELLVIHGNLPHSNA